MLNFTISAQALGLPNQIVNIASVVLPADGTIEDPAPGNNSASDSNLRDSLFADGFEALDIGRESGSYRLPSVALRQVLSEVAQAVYRLSDVDGEALRVHAQVFNGQVQYALAVRGSDAMLHLGAWQSFAAEPTLS